MNQEVYRFSAGECTCVLGDPQAGSWRANVRKLSGTEAVLDGAGDLHANQYVYTTLVFADGPSVALSGLVVTSTTRGVLIQWNHTDPRDAHRVDQVIKSYIDSRKGGTSAAPAPPAAAPQTPAPPTAAAPTAAAVLAPAASTPATGPAKPAPAAASAPLAQPTQATGGTRASQSVADSLLKRSKKVNAKDLASRLETVQVLDVRAIHDLVAQAVHEALQFQDARFSESEKKKLLEEAEESFQERLSVFKAEKKNLEEGAHLLQEQLQRAQMLLEEEKSRIVSANQFTVSDAGIVELETRMGRLLEHIVVKQCVPEPLEKEMREVVHRLLDDERAKISAKAEEAQSDRVALLERKIQRLSGSLESAEKERDRAQRRANALEASGGALRSVMDAGLDEDDPLREKKLDLLKQILEQNREFRVLAAKEGRLPAQEPAREIQEIAPPQTAAEDEKPVDPDDLPWEVTAANAASPPGEAKFRKPGKG